ncbi:predicted protein [Plenodomus lingam JN3]|uniref:Predicted protein n=1 Tax=Leptosphaeria maculans (strain JN3 / isolate v23.1.3 / race Av1-4-5-6-7-8) TaxID=985895 RepID=E4ZIT2_LEPMJ|nr:predicted protein [Plenodomus lingam JN3]CBX91103.1 predicted protein [Plenodomus lingam JN3]
MTNEARTTDRVQAISDVCHGLRHAESCASVEVPLAQPTLVSALWSKLQQGGETTERPGTVLDSLESYRLGFRTSPGGCDPGANQRPVSIDWVTHTPVAQYSLLLYTPPGGGLDACSTPPTTEQLRGTRATGAEQGDAQASGSGARVVSGARVSASPSSGPPLVLLSSRPVAGLATGHLHKRSPACRQTDRHSESTREIVGEKEK